MVSKKEIVAQLKRIGFNHKGWGKSEVSELHNIILPGEEIYECVNGIYESGFAMLIATDIRVLLVDKKPLNYLTVEDMRFDMISQMDYNHRLFGAEINISSGGKNLKFQSFNQIKLRKLIGHVQHCMAESKKDQSTHQVNQVSHLEQINRQLQAYLVAQHQYQQQIHEMGLTTEETQSAGSPLPAPPKPSNELADYLFAQSLIAQYQETHTDFQDATEAADQVKEREAGATVLRTAVENSRENQMEGIYQEGFKEVFGDRPTTLQQVAQEQSTEPQFVNANVEKKDTGSFDLNPVHAIFSRAPTVLRNRRLKLRNA